MTKHYALITGASAGLGAEFARQLAGRGHNLVLVARREGKLRELADDLVTTYKVKVEIIEADLSEPSAPEMIATQCRERGLHIDWLINNAGVAGPDLLLDREWSERDVQAAPTPVAFGRQGCWCSVLQGFVVHVLLYRFCGQCRFRRWRL